MKALRVTINFWLWDLAQTRVEADCWPRPFWMWLLRTMDRVHAF